jgi:hypothetical protein
MIATSALEQVETWVRDAVTGVGDWVGSITTPGWVLLALAALAIIWVVSAIRAQTRLGPIDIVPLEFDKDDSTNSSPSPKLLALTADFRERLWKLGLTPPPLVPEGTPQADIIAAVGEVTPQGKAIASFLKFLPTPPRPPSFKVTSTLTSASSTSCGVSFMLQSLTGGPPYLGAVADCADHRVALHGAAARIYQQITRSAPEVFPLWVRWRTVEALDAYVGGCDESDGGDLDAAIAALEDAVAQSPFNALGAMRLGNLFEQCAAAHNIPWKVAFFQAHALKRYLAVARLWPTLVEARYRASVDSAALAATYADPRLTEDQRAAIVRIVPIPRRADDDAPKADAAAEGQDGTTFADRLRTLAGRESAATLQLLRWYYTIVRERRFRNQFEPKGAARRQLNHTVRISRHCVRMRAINARPTTRGLQLEVRGHEALVHVVHLLFGRANVTWQGRYNAACFDALQLAGPHLGDDEERRKRVADRALRNLDCAIREAAGPLTRTWVENDPDFEVFHGEAAG